MSPCDALLALPAGAPLGPELAAHLETSAATWLTTTGVAIPSVRPSAASHIGSRAARVATNCAIRSCTISRTSATSRPAPSTAQAIALVTVAMPSSAVRCSAAW